MEFTLELVIWFIFGFFIAIMMLNFVFDVDYENFYDKIKYTFTGEKNNEITEGKSIDDAILMSLKLWKECGFGELNKSQTIYINETGELDKVIYFDKIKKWDLCHIIQSPSNDCGEIREEFEIMGSIETPKIIKVECNSFTSTLHIS